MKEQSIQFVIDIDGATALAYVNGTLSLSGDDGQWRPVTIRESLSFMTRTHAAVVTMKSDSLGDWDPAARAQWFRDVEALVAGLEASAPFTVEINASLASTVDAACQAAGMSRDEFTQLALEKYFGGES